MQRNEQIDKQKQFSLYLYLYYNGNGFYTFSGSDLYHRLLSFSCKKSTDEGLENAGMKNNPSLAFTPQST